MSRNPRLWLVLAAAAAASSCARVSVPLGDNLGGEGDADLATPVAAPDLGDGDTGGSRDLAVAGDLATPGSSADLAAPRDLATPRDLVVVAPCFPVINEIQTQTTQAATEEFIEIYNPCGAAVSVAGWKLGYRAASNTTPVSSSDSSTLYTFSGSLAGGAYFVLGGSGFTGTKNASLPSGLATSGSTALRDGTGAVVDSVAWGSVTAGNAFIEAAAAPLPPSLSSPGGSIERLPDGADSNDNSHDFQTATAATPGAANH